MTIYFYPLVLRRRNLMLKVANGHAQSQISHYLSQAKTGLQNYCDVLFTLLTPGRPSSHAGVQNSKVPGEVTRNIDSVLFIQPGIMKAGFFINSILGVNTHKASFTLQMGLMYMASWHGYISQAFFFMSKLPWPWQTKIIETSVEGLGEVTVKIISCPGIVQSTQGSDLCPLRRMPCRP